MEEITLNLIPGGATQVVHASQFDEGRQFKLVTYYGDEPFNPSTYTAQFEAIKPDGNIIQADVAKDSTSVTVTTTEQMCAVEGDTICEIRFSISDTVIGSANFILRVELDPIFAGTNSQSEGPVAETIDWIKNNKENVLIAGSNIQISRTSGDSPRTTISATDTTYTAGNHISITGNNNTISATYTAGTGITITGDEIADVPYTAGSGISISSNREISANISTLPIASTATLGCIKVGANLVIDPDGTLSSTGGGGGGGYEYLAGDNIQISDARRISATDTTYTAGNGIDITGANNEISVDMSDLSDASTASAGLMSAADKIKLDGIESGANNYTLPLATTSSLGGVKVGDNLQINSNGVLSSRVASTASLGVVKVGDNLQISDGVLSSRVASTASLGVVKVGDNLNISSNGTLSVPTTSSVTSGSSTIVTSGGVWTYINQTILNASY